MNKKMGIGFVGGDLRQLRVARRFALDGFDIKIFGFEDMYGELLDDGITVVNSAEEALEEVGVVVLPLPYSVNGDTINAPGYVGKIYISDVFKGLKKEQILFVGKSDDKISALASLYSAHVVDYFDREELALLNAIPTAEGAVAIAMNETPFTLHGSKCLIIGNGRIGKILASMLSALHANVAVACRKYHDLAWVNACGNEAVALGGLSNRISDFDIIFNTVPSMVLDFKLLSKVKKDVLIIDLASKPGGVGLILDKEITDYLPLKMIKV